MPGGLEAGSVHGASLLSEFGLVMDLVHSAGSIVWLMTVGVLGLLCFVWWFSLLRTFVAFICAARVSPNSLSRSLDADEVHRLGG